MSDLAKLLAALAERLGTRCGIASPVNHLAERANAAGAVDLLAILAMPLDQFALERHGLEIRVPWHAETLWFVPDERDAAALGREGVGRGRVWTVRELAAMMPLSVSAPTRTLALAKCAIDGDLVEVRDLNIGRKREGGGARLRHPESWAPLRGNAVPGPRPAARARSATVPARPGEGRGRGA